jgi:regulator of replication initiation timing
MESKQPVNFYFGNNLKESGIGSDSSDKTSTNYIILQNDFFHERVKELENEITELKSQVEELENDNESLEISKTSLKGYIKNEGEYNRLAKNLVEIYDITLGTIPKIKEEIEWNIKYFGTAFIMLEICMLIYKFYNFDILSIIELIILNGLVSYIILKLYKPYIQLINIKNIKNIQSVHKIKQDMKDASRGNDYLSELIDKI